MSRIPEILAPAGEPDAGYAALHYGADAVYLGLARFSARAEATNFTPEQLAEFTAYAHSLAPRRRVYLALNTILKQDELAGAVETLSVGRECGVDAVIVQDLGAARLARQHFPELRLHASTQMAVHSLEGARAAGRLGFDRVVMARELTLGELAPVAAGAGLEIEVFIHGTLCYSYSGLCLFSSLAAGRSGNRGRCVYSCREAALTPDGRVHPFSLKDLALGGRVLDLAGIGVSSLKIEGRKKSPLYVGATVDYYRRILDGKMTPEAAAEAEAGLKTIFARPWTRLFLDGRDNPEAADPDVVGHRGSAIGRIEGFVRTPAGPGIRFRPALPVERHDGIQVDLPGQARPFGFGVDNLYQAKGKRLEPVFAAPAGEELAVALPEDAPPLSPGLPLYLSSSQAIKRSFPFFRPKPGEFAPRHPADVAVWLAAGPGAGEEAGLARCHAASGGASFGLEETLAAFPARDAEGAEKAAREAFVRMGGDGFELAGWRFENPAGLFVRPGDWNRLRRKLLAGLAEARKKDRELARADLARKISPPAAQAEPTAAPARVDAASFAWSLFADSAAALSDFEAGDFAPCAEVVVGIDDRPDAAGDAALDEALARLADLAGRDKIRLALPLILRPPESAGLARRLDRLWEHGWRKWLAPGLAGWLALADRPGADLAADWTIPVLNRLAAEQLFAMGFGAVTLSPEDEAGNLATLAREFADRSWLVVYSDLPLFISAACAHAHLGRCRRQAGAAAGRPTACPEAGRPLALAMERSGGVSVRPTQCGSIVTSDTPFSLLPHLDAIRELGLSRLRFELRWKNHLPNGAVGLWRRTLEGKFSPGRAGNFTRGLL